MGSFALRPRSEYTPHAAPARVANIRDKLQALAAREPRVRVLTNVGDEVGVPRPKVLRIALVNALAPSMMNRRQTLGSRPRPIR